MQDYYWKWRFKHPDPDAFFRVIEKASDIELDWFKHEFIYTTHHIDYAIDSVRSENNKSFCVLKNIGDLPMPVELLVNLKDGRTLKYYIPLNLMRGQKYFSTEDVPIKNKAWSWVNPTYSLELDFPKEKIERIQLNPEGKLADIDPSNDRWPSVNE